MKKNEKSRFSTFPSWVNSETNALLHAPISTGQVAKHSTQLHKDPQKIAARIAPGSLIVQMSWIGCAARWCCGVNTTYWF